MNLEDIAKIAGVSRSTVSRVINKEGYVSPATRSRVMEVVEALNFTPNHAARTLVTQRSHVVGVVVPGTAKVFFGDNSYFPMLLQGVAEAVNVHHYNMLLWLGESNEQREQFNQRILRDRICDGLVLASVFVDDPIVTELVSSNRTFVMVERPMIYEDRVSYVTSDNVQAGRMATEHLISLGYRRIAHITGHMNISDGRERLQGYREALEASGLGYDPDLVYEGSFSYEGGYEGMTHLLPKRPDAVFIASDTAARSAIQVIEAAGLRVPEDIGIVGFDDLDVATNATPHLTTIRQHVQEKGTAALNLLIDLIRGQVKGPQRVILPTELIVRESCGAKIRAL